MHGVGIETHLVICFLTWQVYAEGTLVFLDLAGVCRRDTAPLHAVKLACKCHS